MPVQYNPYYNPIYGAQYGMGTGMGFTSQIPGVARDSTSGIYVPNSTAQWTAFMSFIGLATGNPSFVWLCDEPSGNLVDEVAALALAPNASPLYNQPVSGWTRPGVGTVAGTANQRFSSANAALPDILTTSALQISYVGVSATGAVRAIQSLGTTRLETRHTSVSPRLVAGATTGTGAATVGTQVRPWVSSVNRVGLSEALYTDQEKVPIGVFDGTVTGKFLELGAASVTPASATYLYHVLFTGAAAQLTDGQLRTMLQGLGWTIAW